MLPSFTIQNSNMHGKCYTGVCLEVTICTSCECDNSDIADSNVIELLLYKLQIVLYNFTSLFKRAIGVVIQDFAIGTECFGFDSWAGGNRCCQWLVTFAMFIRSCLAQALIRVYGPCSSLRASA